MHARRLNELIADTAESLERKVERFVREGRKVHLSSSFQTQSVPLLHLMSTLSNANLVQVILIDTGFLFPETYLFAQQLKNRFGLRVREVRSNRDYSEQLGTDHRFKFASDIEACCKLNKVDPIEQFIETGDVWISGIRADQSKVRAQKETIETDDRGVIRYHPMLEWSGRDVHRYIAQHGLPKHPLESLGYKSIGCLPCTRKWSALDLEDGQRGGRWEGSQKTECGLHTS
tara:strand:- start:2852 stop:3544 length:693 start_codon:yes stop_codon:yes gene_type:complete